MQPHSFICFLSLLAPALGSRPRQHALRASSDPYDAVIVGGGLSGLSAARSLLQQGRSVLVLEARNRTGGRVHNKPIPNIPGGYTEVGAEFVGPTQDEVIALAKELDLALFPTYNNGSNIFYGSDKRPQPYAADGGLTGQIPPVDLISLLQLSQTQAAIDDMAAQIDVKQPWKAAKAAEWDRQTLGTWLDKRGLTPDARKLIDVGVVSVFASETYELSLLYALAYVAAAGNSTTVGTFERLTSTANAAQAFRVEGGTELLASRLATKIGSSNILFNSPVRSIVRQSSDSGLYTLTTRSGQSYRAKHVIVAMSPPLAARIEYSPLLPASRDQLAQHMPMSSIGKAIAAYSTPFWRQSNLTGQTVSFNGTTRTTFDNSPSNGSFGALMGFIDGERMRALDSASEQDIQSLVKKDFVKYYGKKAQDVKSWVVQRWDLEEFSRGGPVAIAGPGVLTQFGEALRKQAGNIHFAGTEASDYWVGYMDGAIRSGKRAAAEVQKQL